MTTVDVRPSGNHHSGALFGAARPASYGLSRRLPLAQRSVLVRKVALLERRLFDEDGRLRPDLGDEVAGTLLGEINDLRHDLGWLSVDLRHHHTWPADTVC